MTKIINHKDLELSIGDDVCCDVNKLKVVGHFLYDNNLVVVQRRGEDRFFLANAGPESDLTHSQSITGRHVVLGSPETLRIVYEKYVKPLEDPTNPSPVLLPLFSPVRSRIMIAGAEAVYIDMEYYGDNLVHSPELLATMQEHRFFYIDTERPHWIFNI